MCMELEVGSLASARGKRFSDMTQCGESCLNITPNGTVDCISNFQLNP